MANPKDEIITEQMKEMFVTMINEEERKDSSSCSGGGAVSENELAESHAGADNELNVPTKDVSKLLPEGNSPTAVRCLLDSIKDQEGILKEIEAALKGVDFSKFSTVGETSGVSSSSAKTNLEASKNSTSQTTPNFQEALVQKMRGIEIERTDPSSPLYSAKSFESLRLKPDLVTGIYAMGYDAPSKIQETAVPNLLVYPPVNMIAQSQSGTGKTATYLMVVLSRIDATQNYPQALCLVPTYELALQTAEVTTKMCKYMRPSVCIKLAVRGEDLARGSKITDHIIIGTPGKAMDWVLKFKFITPELLKVFVLDEADVMISTQGHQSQSLRIRRSLPATCQIMLFSATYGEEVMKFASKIVPNPLIIRLKKEEESLDNIKQYWVKCMNEGEKYNAITNIYGVVMVGQAMIFCEKKKIAVWLSEMMKNDGHSVALLTGDLSIDDRTAVFNSFKNGDFKVMICTNVLARGIDIEHVSFVVNFDLPITASGDPDFETYLHRIGRTGRFGKMGIAINLVDSKRNCEIIMEIESHFGKPILYLDTSDLEQVEKLNN